MILSYSILQPGMLHCWTRFCTRTRLPSKPPHIIYSWIVREISLHDFSYEAINYKESNIGLQAMEGCASVMGSQHSVSCNL